MKEANQEMAGVIAPPPLVYFGTLVVGLIAHYFVPLAFLPNGAAPIVGGVLIVLGLALGIFAIVSMRRAGTSPDPRQPVRTLVVHGPYHLTRNPIYLGFAAIYLGVTAMFNSLAALGLFPVALLVIHFGVILREEKYLARKFGQEYVRYTQTVRRWI